MQLQEIIALRPAASVVRLERILSRINLFQIAQEIQNISLNTEQLLTSSDWVTEFFEYINDNLFPIHNGEMLEAGEDEDSAVFDYIFINNPLSGWDNYDPEEFNGAYRMGMYLHHQVEEFSDLPSYWEINQDGWKFIERQIKKHRPPFRYFYDLFSALDHSRDNQIWDWADENGVLIPWSKENIQSLAEDSKQVAEDMTHFEELSKWLTVQRNYKNAVQYWRKAIIKAHELFPRADG